MIYFDHVKNVWVWEEEYPGLSEEEIAAGDADLMRQIGVKWDD